MIITNLSCNRAETKALSIKMNYELYIHLYISINLLKKSLSNGLMFLEAGPLTVTQHQEAPIR